MKFKEFYSDFTLISLFFLFFTTSMIYANSNENVTFKFNLDSSVVGPNATSKILILERSEEFYNIEEMPKLCEVTLKTGIYSYSVNFSLPKTQFIFLNFYPLNVTKIPLIISPNDTVVVYVSNNPEMRDVKLKIDYSGNEKNKNDVLKEFKELLPTKNYLNWTKLAESNEFDKILDSLNDFKNKKQKLTESFFLFNNIKDQAFVTMLEDCAKSEYQYLLTFYINHFYKNSKLENNMIDSIFFNHIIPDYNRYYQLHKMYVPKILSLTKNTILKTYNKIHSIKEQKNIDTKITAFKEYLAGDALKESISSLIELEIAFAEYNMIDEPKIEELINNNSTILDSNNIKYINTILSAKKAVRKGKYLPEFFVQDTAGSYISSKRIISQNTYILFWATWCKPCLEHLKTIVEFSDLLKKKNIQLVIISLDGYMSKWLLYVKNNLSNYNNYISLGSDGSSAGKTLGINQIPVSVLVNKDGKILDYSSFFPGDNDIENLIDKLLKE